MSKKIPLTQGYSAIVDDDDYEWLSRWKWRFMPARGRTQGYALRTAYTNGKRTILMHRQILNAPRGKHVDHINGSGLDNRRCNLRFASIAENARNAAPQQGKLSRFKGVSRDKRRGKWTARIVINYRVICLGYFKSEIKAARVYNEAAKRYFGKFARLNEI